jgi:signal peptidase I
MFNEETEQKEELVERRGGESVIVFVWDLVKVLIISLVVVLVVHNYIAQPFIVSGSSMEPTFHTGEYLVIDELSYELGNPVRGDIVVFKYPKDTSQYFIKRIIGLPGEKVRIEEDGEVRIFNAENPDGFILEEPYLPSQNVTFPASTSSIVQLGSGEFFVLGDNRMASSDSRFWGPVPEKNIVGKAFIRAFPFNEITKFDKVIYSE